MAARTSLQSVNELSEDELTDKEDEEDELSEDELSEVENLLVLTVVRRRQQRREEPHWQSRPGVRKSAATVLNEAQIDKILHKDPAACYEATRLRQPVLHQLIDTLTVDYGLRAGREIPAAAQVVIFLHLAGHRVTHRQITLIYGTCKRTVQKIVRKLLDLLCKLFKAVVIQPTGDEGTPAFIRDNETLFPYFAGCVRALDGTYVPVRLRGTLPTAYRSRKAILAQNVLLACDFNLRVTYCLAGYKGSANDSTVLKKAKQQGFGHGLADNHYYLADGGYSKKEKLVLVPFQRTAYHLDELARAGRRPVTAEELFNLRHARARNCVERLNGVLKARWPGLRDGPNVGYSIRQQARFVYALVAIHNFILSHGQAIDTEDFVLDGRINLQPSRTLRPPLNVGNDDEMVRRRAAIAQEMWRDYRNN